MLQQVQLRGINCFGGEGVTLGPLAPVNLLFGPNGSGKTSISRALHDPESFPLTHIEEVGSSCEIHVYNRDYVSRTFGTSSSLPGIFMLGSNAQELLDQIEATKGLYAKMEADWATTNSLLHGDDSNTGELARLQSIEAEYLDAAWKARDSVPPEIDEVIRAGTRKNKKGFLAKCEQVADEFSSSDLKLDDLVEDAKSLFDPATKPTELIPEFSGRPPQHAKAKALLGKRSWRTRLGFSRVFNTTIMRREFVRSASKTRHWNWRVSFLNSSTLHTKKRSQMSSALSRKQRSTKPASTHSSKPIRRQYPARLGLASMHPYSTS